MKAVAEVARIVESDGGLMKIQDAIEGFLLDRRPQCSDDTMRWYKQKLGRWRRYMDSVGVTTIEQITVGHLRAFIVEIQQTPADAENPFKPTKEDGSTISDLTVHGYAQVVKTFCRWIYQEELVDKDPSARLAMPKVGKYVIEPFSVEHLEAMLSACDKRTPLGFRDYTMVTLMADTGIRLSELIGLTLDNFYQVNSQGKSHIKVLGKGKREREVGVSPQVAKLLWKYTRMYRQPRNPSDKHIFLGRYGKPMGKRGIEDVISRLREAAGIDDVRCSPHTFRHTFSTMYLEQGGTLEKLSRELGHSKTSVTEQYIKTLPLSVARQDHEEFSPIRRLKIHSRRLRQGDVG
jgi:site-specific recombinase XerD